MKLFCVWIVLIVSSFSVYAACPQGLHHVFLLHGVGGSKATFGSLPTILEKEISCVRARTFEYKTGSNLTTYDFAKDFQDFLNAEKNKSLFPGDKISLIMHSQGGLVGSLWLKNFASQDPIVMKQISSFITLSTPFWGADIAHVGKVLFYSLPFERNFLSPFGKNELNEMSYGSSTIMDLAVNLDSTWEKFPNIKPFIVAGMKRLYGPKLLEDDVIVPTYAMNPSRYYLSETLNLFDKPTFVPSGAFSKSRDQKMLIVSADHIKLTQSGVADIPKACLDDINCGHPSLKAILSQLRGEEVKQEKDYPLSRFRVTLVFNNPEVLNYDEKDLSLVVGKLSEDIQVPAIERLNPFSGNSQRKKGFAFSFSGISKKYGEKEVSVMLKYRNQVLKTYEVPVRSGTSSFIDVTLSAK